MTNPAPGWYPDPHQPNTQRYWNGAAWTEQTAPGVGPVYQAAPYAPYVMVAAPSNGFATASLVFGIIGFLLTPIPFGIGLVLGGIPDVLAIVFGIVGLSRASLFGGRGIGPGLTGLILGGLGFFSIFIGAGTLW
ncbi:DUF2510 domain-containing protein [Microbacteriaceae bacterium VKM Ac-2855]|nr:DUF2510 domain-containing protein [Microbacteriaceae bacterium VKM Ac-2855]